MLEVAWSSWEFDALAFLEVTCGHPLRTLGMTLMRRHNLIEEFSLEEAKLESFLDAIEAGYPEDNPYHNRAHAASVLHFLHNLLLHAGVAEVAKCAAPPSSSTSRQCSFIILVGILAAVAVDFEHEGVTNSFHMQCRSTRATVHGSKSCNERHHAAAALRLLERPEYNFLGSMPEIIQLRQLVSDMIVGTDSAQHSDILGEFTAMLGANGAGSVGLCTVASAEEAVLVLKIALKCADFGHSTMQWGTHLRWSDRLENEFFLQGDREKQLGLAVSDLMDRDTPGATQTQVAWFGFAVLPLFRAFQQAFPATEELVSKVEANWQRWHDIDRALAAERLQS